MEPIFKSLQEYVDTGEYFIDARNWYNHKYIHPFSERSFLFILAIVACVVFFGIFINIHASFPLVTQVRYSINADTTANKTAQIIRADQIDDDPLASITDIMVRKYVTGRENYDYNNLKKQFIYVKNNSTRIVFRKFYNDMNIDNSNSPLLRYQKDIRRTIEVISSDLIHNKAQIKFNSVAKDSSGELIENSLWLATIEFEIDDINPNLPSGSRFNFTVTDYQLKLLEDKKKK